MVHSRVHELVHVAQECKAVFSLEFPKHPARRERTQVAARETGHAVGMDAKRRKYPIERGVGRVSGNHCLGVSASREDIGVVSVVRRRREHERRRYELARTCALQRGLQLVERHSTFAETHG